MSELEEIRVALKLTQQEFAPLLGAASHSAITRWENAPNTRSSLQALAKAKVVFEQKTGRKWVSAGFPTAGGGSLGVSRDEFLKWTGRIESLEQQLRALSPNLDAVKDLDRRVQKLESRKASRG